MFFYCIVPVAPIRIDPSHKCEMVTQLLFGEAVEILETIAGGWIKIRCHFDGYEGWAMSSHLTIKSYDAVWDYRLADEWSNDVFLDRQFMHVPFGSHIPYYSSQIISSKQQWDFSRVLVSKRESRPVDNLREYASMYLNSPYLWGGKSVYGIDCSGLVQQVFKWANILLPRDAWQQAEKGEALHFLQEGQLGDVAFFDNEEGRIIHTGILLNDHEILHSSGKVRIDAIDTEGILNKETGVRTHHLRIIKRMK